MHMIVLSLALALAGMLHGIHPLDNPGGPSGHSHSHATPFDNPGGPSGH